MASHERIERLIPWYVNGTLDEAEMDAVNQHLTDCASCRLSVQAEVGFARALRAEPPGLRRLPRSDTAWSELAGRLPRGKPRRRTAPAALLGALALAIAAASFLAGQQVQPAAFRTLTTDAAHHGPVIQILFESSTPERDIRDVVHRSGGTVIAGPTEGGLYRIGLPGGSDGQASAAALRKVPGVRWAALEAP